MTITLALDLLLALLARTSAISALIAKARAEGRTKLTPEEFEQITGADDASRATLVQAIADAKREGR